MTGEAPPPDAGLPGPGSPAGGSQTPEAAGRLIVISGPSGVGKDTVLHELFRAAPWLTYSISYTTRPPRPGEVDGVAYSFVDEPSFLALRDGHKLLECARVHGHWYGTGEARVREALARGEDIVLKIDVQGAASIRERVDGAVFIFLLPPTAEELRRRLEDRATESAESLELRWENARRELAEQEWYDHRVVNDDVHRAAREILDIIERSRAPEVHQ